MKIIDRVIGNIPRFFPEMQNTGSLLGLIASSC